MTVLLGDNLIELKKIASETVDLVYLDPPFFTQKRQSLKSREGKEFSFGDNWNTLDEYLGYMKVRLIECQRVLKNTGSIFLHCDRTVSHYLRMILDSVFGIENFQSEIIWSYRRWSNSKKGLLNNHQNIYFYSKSKNFKYFQQFTDYSPTTNVDQILFDRKRGMQGKVVYKLDDTGTPIIGQAKRGVPLSDVWDIPYLNPKAKERVGYPTQKPVLLLEQIIKLVTEENDVVLDPFMGSGTTLVASKILGRKGIGIDCLRDAADLAKHRLNNVVKTESNVMKVGEQSYQNKTEEELQILRQLNAVIVQRNKGIDGFLPEYIDEKPVPIKVQKPNEYLDESKTLLKSAMKKKQAKVAILIKTHEEGTLFSEDVQDDENILIADKYDLLVKNWIAKRIAISE